MIINAHSHLLPYPHEIPNFMKDKKIFWIDEDRKYMRQQQWKRPINGFGFFLDEKLQWMDKYHIDKAVILNLSQLYGNGYDKATASDVMRFQNDYNASVEQNNASKFIGGFVIQPAYIDAALKEIDRCVAENKMKLCCLPTHFKHTDGSWKSIVDDHCLPIFELLNHYQLAVEIHPYDAEEIIQLHDQFWRFHLVWMCAQTADTFHLFTLKNFPAIYPNIRTCFAHGNLFSLVNIGRRMQGFEGRPDLFEKTVAPTANFSAPNIYVDSIVHDLDTFELLLKKVNIENIVFGLDDPYPLGETDIVPGCYPGQLLNQAIDNGILLNEEKDLICHTNIEQWLNIKF